LIDELGAQLLKITSPKATPHEAAASAELRKLWGINFGVYTFDETAESEASLVICPALSIYGTSTLNEFYEALQNKEAANGFLNRWLLIEVKGVRPPEREPIVDARVPPDIIEACQALYQDPPNAIDTPAIWGTATFGFRLGWGSFATMRPISRATLLPSRARRTAA
jgi:hypothetical protein